MYTVILYLFCTTIVLHYICEYVIIKKTKEVLVWVDFAISVEIP